jgi:NADH-quinone oxidoreductase subunit A
LTALEVACYKPTAFPGSRARLQERGESHPMLSAYIPIVLFVAVATGFAVFTLVFTGLIHPSKYNKVKLEPYECGIEPTTDARDRYSIRYYLVAMLFVIFDVETVFMFPWAVIFDQLMLFGLIEMLVFIFILVVGYYYAWQKGALEWA